MNLAPVFQTEGWACLLLCNTWNLGSIFKRAVVIIQCVLWLDTCSL